MKPIHSLLNKRILDIITQNDAEPLQARPFTFWFYSDEEDNIKRLADQMQSCGYTICFCGVSVSGNYLCIAGRELTPSLEYLDKLWVDMQLLADRMGVVYDGWESELSF